MASAMDKGEEVGVILAERCFLASWEFDIPSFFKSCKEMGCKWVVPRKQKLANIDTPFSFLVFVVLWRFPFFAFAWLSFRWALLRDFE